MTAAGLASRCDRVITLALLPLLAMTTAIGLLSDGAHHDDDLTHFLMARWAHWFPEYLLHPWGRPGLTLPLACVAWIGDSSLGWHAGRFLSTVVTALGALLAARLAARLRIPNAWLVIVFCYLQPFNALLACTTLTENFAAFYLVAAVALLYAGRVVSASAVFSLALVTRHEAVILLPLWWLGSLAVQTTARRRVAAVFLAVWAPIAHNLAFRAVFGQWPVLAFFRPGGSSEYAATGLWSYVPQALYAVPPVLAGLAIIGGVVLLRRGVLLIPALTAVYFATHVGIKAFGLFASGGYARFMVATAPLVAILVVAGFNEMAQQARRRRSSGSGWLVLGAVWVIGLMAFEVERRAGRVVLHDPRLVWLIRAMAGLVLATTVAMWAVSRRRGNRAVRYATVTVLVLACVIQWVAVVRPLRLRSEPRQIREVVDWLAKQHLDAQPLFAPNPWVAYFLGLVELPRAHKGPALLASMPVGTIVLWDSIYSPSDFHRLSLDRMTQSAEYELLRRFGGTGPRRMEVQVFRKIAPTPQPPGPDESYPIDLMAERRAVSGVYYIRPGDG